MFCIFLQSPHLVDMKKVIKCQKEFFAYFNALETRGAKLYIPSTINFVPVIKTFDKCKSFFVHSTI